ncbi:MAG: insulinase family protein [Nitrospinae bacterium]|nr:insulinase family protein [Nitrospinota bacterium]
MIADCLKLFLFALIAAAQPALCLSNGVDAETVRLSNGFEAILVENHNAPVIASVVMVRAGSFREDFSTSGMSHMLEHLLFNGTETRDQKTLYDEQDLRGIYNNAHTTREYTNYMVLSARENFERALDIQSDMLFRSIIPRDKFDKEKGIVLNEIAMSMMGDDYLADEFFNRKYYHGTPYNLPVLGLPETIKNMDRDAVFAFYKKYYVTNNMTAIVMGDFQRADMKEKLEKYFGNAAPGLVPDLTTPPVDYPKTSRIFKSEKKVGKTMIQIGSPAPVPDSEDFFAYNLLVRLESVDFEDRVKALLQAAGEKEPLDSWLGVDFTKGHSTLLARLTLSSGGNADKAIAAVAEELKALAAREFSPGTVRGILASMKMEELSLRERIHYYGMAAAAKIAVGGWDLASGFTSAMEKVSNERLKEAAKKYFSNPVLTATALIPGGKDRDPAEQEKKEYYTGAREASSPSGQSLKLVESWNAGQRPVAASLAAGHAGPEGKPAQPTEDAKIKKTVLPNGLTALVKKSTTGGIFAVHALIKGRSAVEPEGKEGIAELLHDLLNKGTTSRDKDRLRADLMDLGANLKTVDDPSIPFDDYYFSNEYSYIRFETTDEQLKEGLELLSDIMRNPLLDAKEVESEKGRQAEAVKEKERDAASASASLLLKSLLGKNAYNRPARGTQASIKSISVEDLREFHKKYFSPKNIILSIVSGRDVEEIMEQARLSFGDMEGPAPQPVKPPTVQGKEASQGIKPEIIREKLGKSQSYIRVGKRLAAGPQEKGALEVLSSLLSDHISFQLREKEGLSYSAGASIVSHGGTMLFTAGIGTTPDRIGAAKEGLLREITGFAGKDIGEKDVRRAVQQLNSQRLMRTLTRIGQAFYLGLGEFMGKNPGSMDEEARKMEGVTASDIKSAAGKYLTEDEMVTVIVE